MESVIFLVSVNKKDNSEQRHENTCKGADQLGGNRTADLCLCFHYILHRKLNMYTS